LEILQSFMSGNPNASEAEVKEFMAGAFDRSRERLERLAFDELFDEFLKETGYNGGPTGAIKKFRAWLERKRRSIPDL
jgi:hypothetical protein